MLKSGGFDDVRFVVGIGFLVGVVGLGKDDDWSSKFFILMIISLGGQRGKDWVENSKKYRGESVEKENFYFSLEFDLRKLSGSLMMNYKGMIGDEVDMNGEILKRNDDVEGEGEGEELINNNNGFLEE